MKTSLIKTLIVIGTILTFNANAQNDYVIKIQGDSIPCKITTPLIGGAKYKSDTMRESKRIKPTEIREYYIARKDFRERSVYTDSTSSPRFMTIVEKGKISLYQMIYSNYHNGITTSTTEWYVGKGSDYVSDLKTSSLFAFKSKQKRKDNFEEMLKDNKEVYDKYKADDKFSFKQIRNLVHLYNTGKPMEPEKTKDYD
ncbi:MAG: hypothetical protein M3N14_11830 [Bacteroidota bacterium]|nr:hypothetical protein [Bacteroidota bacterium]